MRATPEEMHAISRRAITQTLGFSGIESVTDLVLCLDAIDQQVKTIRESAETIYALFALVKAQAGGMQ